MRIRVFLYAGGWIWAAWLGVALAGQPAVAGQGPVGHAHEHDKDHEKVMADLMKQVPEKEQQRKNPHAAHAHTLTQGKAVYEKHCAVCHGVSGRGDGPAAKALNPKPADFTDREHQQLFPEGAQYWIVTHGWKGTPMPAYKTILTESDRWHAVSYTQTFQRKPAGKGVGDEEGHRHRAEHGHAEGGGGAPQQGH